MYLTKKKISVVVVCYGDEGNIEALYSRLTNVLKKNAPNYEIIYVNDNSPDKSESILRRLASKDKKLTVINHSRNFGAQLGFTSGMVQATGDAVVLMDGDLQDPPELIIDFIKKWNEGYKVVYGVRRQREASLSKFRSWVYHQFYKVFSYLSYVKIPVDTGDFSLMDRIVVDHINSLPERDRFIRGLRAWVGYSSTGVNYIRPERFDRKQSVSTKGWLSGFRWARKAIFSFTFKPIEYVAYMAAATTAVALFGALFYLISYALKGAPQGFTTLAIAILFLAAIQLITLSIIAEYVGKIFEEVKGRPRYIIKEILNDNRNKKDSSHYVPYKN